MGATTEQSAANPSQPPPMQRQLGRFLLRKLLGKSSLTMAWLAHDPRTRADVMLMMPRSAPADLPALERWLGEARRAARLSHPRIAPVIEVGSAEHWPYLVCERRGGVTTLGEYLAGQPAPAPMDVAAWCIDALEGLAYAHDAGVSHDDIGLHSLFIDANGHVGSWGYAVAVIGTRASDGSALDPSRLRAQRAAGERDMLAAGLLLHGLLANQPALEEPDLPSATARMQTEIVRLPWTLPHPVNEALRAIVNRATDRHPHRRYLGARSLQRALSGWRQVQADDKGGALALLVDRLPSLGHLPARAGLAQRVSTLLRMERQRLDELTDVVVQDTALAFELLRSVNSAQFGVHEDGPVTTVRRAIQLIGLVGVRRAATGLRAWPGPLDARGAQALDRGLRMARLAGHLAALLSPGGLDAEAALLAAQMQHLGRLLALYHFPEEAAQITQLMQTVPSTEAEQPPVPGLSETAAAMAVLGVDLDSLASAVARYWGLADSMQAMLRPLAPDQTPRMPDEADGWLRLVASCANEALDAARLPAAQQARGLARVATRYHPTLETTPDLLRETMLRARRRADDDAAVAQAA